MPLSEGLALLDTARPELDAESWRDLAGQQLPHADPAYRQTLLRNVQRIFLDLDNDRIQDSLYIHLLQEGPEQRRSDLFFARYGLAHPWTLLASVELVRPRLEAAEKARTEPAAITIDEWDAFVDRYIDEETSTASRRKTRSNVIGALVSLGVLERESTANLPTRPRRGRPDPLAFGWVVADQLNAQLVGEAPFGWAARDSDAAKLWCTALDYAEACIRAAIAMQVLRPVAVGNKAGVRAVEGWET